MKSPQMKLKFNPPDWLDTPLGIFFSIMTPLCIIGWILFVVWLGWAFSWWFLFLLLLTPTGFIVKWGKNNRFEVNADSIDEE